MNETLTTERSPPAEVWQSVFIAAPRRLAEGAVTYRMIVKRDGREEIIAHDVTIARALIIALEHRGGCGATMFYRDRGSLREYVIGRRRLVGRTFEPVLRGVVPRTARNERDHVHALEFFEEVLEHDARVFFDGRLVRERPAKRTDIKGATR